MDAVNLKKTLKSLDLDTKGGYVLALNWTASFLGDDKDLRSFWQALTDDEIESAKEIQSRF
jgi:hypothetical protein